VERMGRRISQFVEECRGISFTRRLMAIMPNREENAWIEKIVDGSVGLAF